MTQPQTLTHDLPTEIEVAVLEPDFLAHLLIQLEGQWLRAVEKLQLTRQQLHAPGRKIGVHRSGRPLTDRPLTRMTNSWRRRSALAKIPADPDEDHLYQPLAIAQIHEDHPAVITPSMHPARRHDRSGQFLMTCPQ